MDESFAINRAHWDERAPAHFASPGYSVERFIADPAFISDVVSFDVPRLGDIRGVRGVHLQCHIGTDTISLERLGAHMTAVDFSPASLAQARHLAELTRSDVTFVEGDVYDAVELLGAHSFDLVFTGVGALCWLPSVDRWAAVVAELLRPGGRLFIREGHPVVWALDDARRDGTLALEYPYFETTDPLVWDEDNTYVETDVVFQHTVSHSWNHGLGEIVTGLLAHGLRITQLVEHDSVPWEALPGLMTRTDDGKEWRLAQRPERLPLSYTLQAIRAQ